MWPLSPISKSNGSKASSGSRSNGRSSSKGSKQACLLLPAVAVAVLACVALTATTLALVSSSGPARLAGPDGDDVGQGSGPASGALLLQGLREGIRQLQLSQLPTTAYTSRRALNLPAAGQPGPDAGDSTPPAPAPEATQQQQQQQYGESRFEAHGAPAAHMYVHFAAHRISDTTFAVLGLTPGVMQNSSRPVILACHWDYPNPDGPPPPAAADSATAAAAGTTTTTTTNTSSTTVLRAAPVRRYRDVWFGETYGRTYSPLLVHCRFPAPGVDAARGGALHLTVATFSPLPGDTARVQALAAAPGAVPPPGAFRAPFPVVVAVCGPPMHGNLSARAVREWLAYHYALLNNGTDAGGGTAGVHFYLYDAGGLGASPAVQRAVAPFLESVTVVDLRAGAGYDAWYHHQVLGVNDCMARARAHARWAVHLDLDEYLMPAPPRTMAEVLAEHEAVPWVTFPSLPHNTRLCATADDDDGDVEDGADEQQTERWLIERAALRKWRPECWHPPADGRFLCLGAHGRRKVAADPRRVVNAGIHRVLVPERGGVHLTHAVAAVHHYRGTAQRGGAPPCGGEGGGGGKFRLAAARAWAAAMDESRAAAGAPVHGGGQGEEEEEAPWWREDRPDVLDEGMLEQARVAKRYIRANLPAAAIPLPLED